MCVRNVFVLVLLFCCNFQAQWSANSSHGYRNISDNTDMTPQLESTPGLSVNPGEDLKGSELVPFEHEMQEGPVEYAGLPQNLTVSILYLKGSDHELQFNVSWLPSLGRAANEFTVEILSAKNTTYCSPTLCYAYSIPGDATWVLIPDSVSQIADELCALRPSCSYTVNLYPHLWDKNSSLTTRLDLEECVVGVCSCEHKQYLPKPNVTTHIIMSKEGDMFSNIIWTLPIPREPQRLPPAKQRNLSYVVSLNKQIVMNRKHVVPWFDLIEKRIVKFDGLVSEGDITRSLLLPLSKRNASGTPIHPTTKILAKVQLMDDRGCDGPVGNAIAFEPEKPTKSQFPFGVYAIVGALLGVWAMVAVFVLSTRIVKSVLKSFRPAPVSAPREPLRCRPAWFPLQLRTLMKSTAGHRPPRCAITTTVPVAYEPQEWYVLRLLDTSNRFPQPSPGHPLIVVGNDN